MTSSTASRTPLIGITADVSGPSSAPNREPALFLPQRYCAAVESAGGISLVLPVTASRAVIDKTLRHLDGLVISGGDFDIHPRYYGEEPLDVVGNIKEERTEFELELITLALKRSLPLLGICGGAQAINVALGGSLYQDIPSQVPGAGQHQNGEQKEFGGHPIRVHAGTRLRQILGREALEVNTTHHQAVKELGKGLVANATAEDGLIEGIEGLDHPFLLGVQWHPEVLCRRQPAQRKIFSSFTAICSRPGSGT